MSFAGFSLGLTIAGALALAGILYLLQRLKARRRVVHLPALALWTQAARGAPVRVLGGRFRYRLAYLLALAIALLLWVAAAHPVVEPATGGGVRLFYLDTSAALIRSGDAAAAKRALLADVRALPPARREVFAGDGARLLAAGESASLLAARLDDVAAAARPSGFGDWLAAAPLPQGTTVRYYGAWPVARAALAARRGATVRYGYLAAAVPGNRGIVALGVTPAASGAWGKADVFVALADAGGRRPQPDDLAWTLNGRSFVPARVEAAGPGAFVLRDLDAAGGTLTAALRRGDGFSADDRASLRLPDRRAVRVAIGAGVPAAIGAAIRADGGFAISDAAAAQVIVRRADDATRADLPALVLTAPARQDAAFVFAGPGERARGDLSARLDELGLARLDAATLAESLRRPVAADVRDAPRRTISVWSAMFDPRGPFAKSAAMPLFVTQGLRWLTAGDGWIPYAKAGAALPEQSRLYGLATRPAGDDLVPAAAAGDAGAPPGSLVDRGVSAMAADRSPPPPVNGLAGKGPPDVLFVALLLAAGLLLAVEWWLVQRGRMP